MQPQKSPRRNASHRGTMFQRKTFGKPRSGPLRRARAPARMAMGIPIERRIMKQLGMAVNLAPHFRYVRLAKMALWGAPDIEMEPLEWYQPQAAPKYDFAAHGFQMCCGPTDFPEAVRVIIGPTAFSGNLPNPICSYQPNCGVDFQVTSGELGEPIEIPAHTSATRQRCETIFLGPSSFGGSRMLYDEKWQRFTTAHPPLTIPYEAPPTVAIPMPSPDIWAPPQSPWGPEVAQPAPSPKPAYKPYHKPGIDTEIGPNGKGRPTPAPHVLARPRPGEKERKGDTQLDNALQAVAALYDATTEANDVVNVIAQNIKGNPCSRGGIVQKMQCIYNNVDKLDVNGMALGLIRNHYEDKYIYGRIFGTVGKYTPAGTMRPLSNRPDLQVRKINS